jgi:sugar phosphate permease
VPWRKILASPVLWNLSAMYFCYNYAQATYLDWFPTYLREYRRYTLAQMGFYAMLPLLAATLGDLAGGWLSDTLLRRTGRINFSRRSVAIAGFLIGAFSILPAALTSNPQLSVIFSCFAFFGIEVTVGVSWAIPLDVGGDCAGSVSSVMNMCGNIGGAISPTALAYLVKAYGWNAPFLVTSALCVAGAAFYGRIDAGRRMSL